MRIYKTCIHYFTLIDESIFVLDAHLKKKLYLSKQDVSPIFIYFYFLIAYQSIKQEFQMLSEERALIKI